MTDRSGIYVISIVALVAVVGLVTLFLRGGEDQSAPLVLDEEGNIVGEAFAYGKVSSSQAIKKPSQLIRTPSSMVCPRLGWNAARDGLITSIPVSSCLQSYNRIFVFVGGRACTYNDECIPASELARIGFRVAPGAVFPDGHTDHEVSRVRPDILVTYSCSTDGVMAYAENSSSTRVCYP